MKRFTPLINTGKMPESLHIVSGFNENGQTHSQTINPGISLLRGLKNTLFVIYPIFGILFWIILDFMNFTL